MNFNQTIRLCFFEEVLSRKNRNCQKMEMWCSATWNIKHQRLYVQFECLTNELICQINKLANIIHFLLSYAIPLVIQSIWTVVYTFICISRFILRHTNWTVRTCSLFMHPSIYINPYVWKTGCDPPRTQRGLD